MLKSIVEFDFSNKKNMAKSIFKIFSILVLVYVFIITPILMFLWSSEPEIFDVREVTTEITQKNNLKIVAGSHTLATSIHMTDILLNKSGGYLSNDITFPSIVMDNMPRWEFGVVEIERVVTLALRKDLSRSQSQSIEHPYLINAQTAYNNDHAKFLFPNSESKYAESKKSMLKYLIDMSDPNKTEAQFYARADNLRDLLEELNKKLGSISQRLSAASGDTRVNTDLANDPTATQSTSTSSIQKIETSWFKIDDEFYEARGQAWAILHILKAVQYDFDEILTKKNAHASLKQIIRELEDTQDNIGAPLIMNGSGFGMFANHSLVMANYISRANAAIIDLIELLNKG